jgi:hypothetical protein
MEFEPTIPVFVGAKRVQALDRAAGRAIAQAVSCWLLTAARVRARVSSRGICGGQSGTGADFLLVFRFPLPISISPIAPQLGQ